MPDDKPDKPKARSRKTSAPVFISKDAVIMFWFYLSVACVIATAWYVSGICQEQHPTRQYVIIGGKGERRSPEVMTDEELQRHMQDEVHTIVDSVFNRSPAGLDRQQAALSYFTPTAWTSVSDEIESETEVFKLNRIHQKAEIGSLSIEDLAPEDAMDSSTPNAPADTVPSPLGLKRVKAAGQLIRIGTVKKKGSDDQKVFHEVWDIHLVFDFEPNGRLVDNGVYPWTCRSLQLRRRLASSDRTIAANPSPPAS